MINNFKLLDLRESKFWTQEIIAKKLNIPRRTYTDYEIQQNNLPIDLLCKIAMIYNVSAQYICGLTNEKETYGKIRDFNMQKFLNKLKQLRKQHKMKQKDISKVLHCKPPTISRYESGKSKLSIESLIILSKFYQLPIDYILDIIEP